MNKCSGCGAIIEHETISNSIKVEEAYNKLKKKIRREKKKLKLKMKQNN